MTQVTVQLKPAVQSQEEHRRRGHLQSLIDVCRQAAVEAVGPCSDGQPPLVFLEMNNPDALTAEEEAQDQLVSGPTSL